MKQATTNTTFTFGERSFNGWSVYIFETAEDAKQAAIESMKEKKAKGHVVTDQAIIRTDFVKITDEFGCIMEQTTRTCVEVILKSYVDELEEA